jgi:glycosyltransferase involved in cell wall biosynthesis
MAELTEKLLNWLPMTAAVVHDHGPDAQALRERYLRRHPGASYWIGDGPSPTDGWLQGVLDVLVLRFGAVDDPGVLAEQLLEARAWLNPGGVLLVALLDHGGLFTSQQRRDLAQTGLHLTKQGISGGWRVLVLMVASPQPLQIRAIPLREQAGMVDVRIRQPLQALSTLPDVHTQVLRLPVSGRMLAQPSSVPTLVLWQRPLLVPERDARLLQLIKRNGLKLVMDFDDHPMRWPEIEDSDYYLFRASDAVITSTPVLERVFLEFCPSVHVRQNACFELPEMNERLDRSNPDAPLQVLFASLNRSKDAYEYLPSLNAFLKDHPQLFHFHVVGDRSFFDALAPRRKSFEPFLTYSQYQERLAKADLVFCPLSDQFFNRHKSWLKFVEAAAYQKPLLASQVVYSEVIHHGMNGLIASPSSLQSCLESVVHDRGIFGRLGQHAHHDLRSALMIHHSLRAFALWLKGLF